MREVTLRMAILSGIVSGLAIMALLWGGSIVYQDWRFLHLVRVATEAAQMKAGTPAKPPVKPVEPTQ